MQNILLLTYTFPPDNTAAAARPGQLYRYLPEYGYQLKVIASSLEGETRGDVNVMRVPAASGTTSARLASRAAAMFSRFASPYNDRLPWAPYALAWATDLVRSGSVLGIMSTSPFLVSHLVAYRLKRRFGLPWMADFQDPICDNPFRTRKWFYPYDPWFEASLFGRADKLFANTDTVAAAWSARYPEFADKISILWNCFDPGEPICSSPPSTRSYRVLAHVGSLYGDRDPRILLASAGRLGLSGSDVRIRLIGPIEERLRERNSSLLEQLRKRGVLEYNGQLVGRDEAMKETADADFLVVLDLNRSNASVQLPSKLLDYVRHHKPILAFTTKGSPTDRVLAQSGSAYVSIDPSDGDAKIDRHIALFLREPPKASKPTQWFDTNFNARTQAGTVAGLWDVQLGRASVSARTRH